MDQEAEEEERGKEGSGFSGFEGGEGWGGERWGGGEGRKEKESSAALLSPTRSGRGDELMTKIC